MNDKEVSRFLSRVLRHKPELIGVVLHEQGYTDIDTLIKNACEFGKHFDHAQLLSVVANNDKQRYQISDDGTQIRAVQGHSHPGVKRHYEPQTPPSVLYHGTAFKFLDSIKQHGLIAGSRHYVHLSADSDTATRVGARHGKAVVLIINTARMHADGHVFYQAENGVWLTESVAVGYIEFG